MMFGSTRLAVLLLGDRLAVAAVHGDRVEAFTVEAESPAAALRAELEARHLAPRSVALGVARGAVTVKPIDLPAVPGELREIVRFELERHLPFPAEDAPFDVAPIPADRGLAPTTGRRVLVVAADRRLVELALRFADETRLRASSITVAAHDLPALARLPRGRRIAWAHRSSGATDLLFLQGPALVLSRSLPTVESDVVAEEIRRSLATVRWRACDAVWVSGDAGAGEDALAMLGAPVDEPSWTPRAASRLAALPEEGAGALMLALAVASGPRARALDLLPLEQRPRRVTRAQAVTIGLAVLAAVLALGALVAPGYREQRYLGRINAEIARIDPEVRAVESLAREADRKKKLLATIDALETGAVHPLPVLRELTELLPSDAWLTTVSMDQRGVELTGQAAAASTLIPLLENSPLLQRVEFASPVTRGRDREQFRIRAAWEMPSGQFLAARAAATAPAPATARPPAPAPGPSTAPPSGAGEPAPQPHRPTSPNRAPGARS